jgi:hypothetical protein
VELAREPSALVVPRDAVAIDGENAYVGVRRGGRFERQGVSLGAINPYEVVVISGLGEGAVIARNFANGIER